jgi:hypothetical protein
VQPPGQDRHCDQGEHDMTGLHQNGIAPPETGLCPKLCQVYVSTAAAVNANR